MVRDRDFTGMSASLGFQTDLGADAAFVTNLTRSYRAPALEELYNFGPHVGNLVFEIGNPDLERESTLGLDLSVRHQSTRLRGDFNFYVYDIDNFVFAAVTDEVIDGAVGGRDPPGRQPLHRLLTPKGVSGSANRSG